MTTNNMLDTATSPISNEISIGGSSAGGGTGNNASAYIAAYDLLLSYGNGGTPVSPIQDLATYSTGVSGQFLNDSNIGSNPIWGASDVFNTTFPTGRLLSFQILTSGTGATYTPTSAAVNTLIVEMIGGGGGAGGCTGSGTTYAASAGGSSGSYALTCATGFLGSVTTTYTVGTGGAGGTGSGNGTAGTASTWTGVTPTTKGGNASAGVTASATATGIFKNPATVIASTAVTGSIVTSCTSGQYGFFSSLTCTGGAGGAGLYGGGSVGPTLTTAGTTVGNPGTGYGGGGSGCCSYLDATNTNQVGGAGSNGVIIVWEYS